MNTNLPFEDEPEDSENQTPAEPDGDVQPFTNQVTTGAARDLPDEEALRKIWESWGGEQPAKLDESANKPAGTTGSLGQFIKSVTDRLNLQPFNTRSLEMKPGDPPVPPPTPTNPDSGLRLGGDAPSVEQPKTATAPPPEQKSTGKTSTLPYNEIKNLNTRKLQDPKLTTELNQKSTINMVDEEIARRIKAIRSDAAQQQLPPPTPTVTPPFVVEDIEEDTGEDRDDTLAERVKRGVLPADTIKLLITNTMEESEVISVSRELGIDWTQIPVTSRGEKIQFLIDYFANRKNDETPASQTAREEKTLTSKPIFIEAIDEQGWLETDTRLHELQESLIQPQVDGPKPQRSFIGHLQDEFEQASNLTKALIISLSVFAVLLVLAIGILMIANILGNMQPVATPPESAVGIPIPRAIQFPGGWVMELKTGVVNSAGTWDPSGPEWLATTEICRLVSLPWNKQLDAVYNTFSSGDEIMLTMSNGDLIHYKIDATQSIKVSEMNQFFNCSSPSLVIFLVQKGSDTRQVMLAHLNNPVFQTKVTVTALPSQAAPAGVDASPTP